MLMVFGQEGQAQLFRFVVNAKCFGAEAAETGYFIGHIGVQLVTLIVRISQGNGGGDAAAVKDNLHIIARILEFAGCLEGVDNAA